MGCFKLSYYDQEALEKNAFCSQEIETKSGVAQKKRSSMYAFAFNGQERDDEIRGTGNHYNYNARVYDPRLAKFLSVDPLTKEYPFYSPYQFASNTPIMAVDMDGLEAVIVNQVDQTITIIGNVYFVTEGPYSIANLTPEIKKEIASAIVDKVASDPNLCKLANYDVSVQLTYVDAGDYDHAKELAKNSTISYDDGTENGAKAEDYKTGVIILYAPENTDVYVEVFKNNSGRLGAYETVDEDEDGKGDFKRISIREPLKSWTKTGTQGEIKEWKVARVIHEMGHFLFTLGHPRDAGTTEGITADDADDQKLIPNDIRSAVNKGDILKKTVESKE